MDISLGLLVVLLLILGAEFVNGWTDAPNAIATVVHTRPLGPYQAVVMAGVLNLLGVLSGTAVAATICKGITAIMGVGATRRLSAVRWGVTRELVTAWVLTFPICAAISWTVVKTMRTFF